MPKYVSLLSWTEQGVKAAKDTVRRYEEGRTRAAEQGVTIDALWTMGPYDAVLIIDAPDDATASRTAIGLAAQGFVRTLTMRAYTKEEMGSIVGGL